MIAELARDDYGDLVAEGLAPTLDDFDRLNQLALRLEDGAETTPANHPRIGWAGDVPFHEPTVAALMWLNDYAGRASGDAETQQTFFWFACAHATKPDTFDRLETPKGIGLAVRAWLRSVPCTPAEIERACRYAAWGFDDAVPAKSPMRMNHEKRRNADAAAENLTKLERLVASAAASGISYAELMAQTPSRLNAMVLAAQIEAGAVLTRDVAKLQVDYSCTLAEIRARLIKEKGSTHGGE